MSDNLPMLSPRKRQILYSAVDNYIKGSNPITSLLIQKTEMQDLSTATLRNELASLEAMGFLKQLHTSSGRVPTTKGYRFFVNEILSNLNYTTSELCSVKDELFSKTNNLSEIIKSIAETISQKTNYPAVVVFDGFKELLVKSIKIFYLISGQVLVLVETNAGVVTNTISASIEITSEDCENASTLFNSVFAGKSIGYLMDNIDSFSDKVREELDKYGEIFKLVLIVLENYAKSSGGAQSGGLVKLLNSPEYSDVQKARDILNILSDKSELKDIFDTEDEDGVYVKIGEELKNEKLSDCAVITTPIKIDGKKVASIGVIGPERIDYAEIASALKIIADEINEKRSSKDKGGG